MTGPIDNSRRICIVGAGAIGGVLAVRLALAGRNVFVVDNNDEHLHAIRSQGLKVEGAWSATASIPAVHIDNLSEKLSLVVLAVKTGAVEAVIDRIRVHLSPQSGVVLLQNGLIAHAVAQRIHPDIIFPGSVAYGGHLVAPGVIRHGADGDIAIGAYNTAQSVSARQIVTDLSPFGSVEFHENIWGRIWGKTIIAVLLAAAAVDGRPTHEVFADPDARNVLHRLICEAAAIATAEGVDLEPVKGVNFTGIAPGSSMDDAEVDTQFQTLIAVVRSGLPHKTHSGVYYNLKVMRQSTETTEILDPIIQLAARHGLVCSVLRNLRTALQRLEINPDEMSPPSLRALA